MHRKASILVVIASAACFATLSVLARLAYAEGAAPLPLLSWRFFIAGVLLLGYLALFDPAGLRAGLADLPRYAALSITGYGAASVCFFFALRFASASVVTVLLYAYPAIVAVADAALRRQRVGFARATALAVTFIGCALASGVTDPGLRVSPAGIVLALGAAVGYAVFTLLSARIAADRPRLVLMGYTFALAALAVSGVALATGESLDPVGWTPALWVLLALLVAVPTLLAVVLFLRGVRELGAPQAALVSAAEPVFTIALAAAVLGERMTAMQLAGAALVFGGIVLSEWPRRPGDAPAAL